MTTVKEDEEIVKRKSRILGDSDVDEVLKL